MKDLMFEDDLKEVELSQSEVYFEWWLEELKSVGLILEWHRAERFILRSPLIFDYLQHYKVKDPLVKQVNILQSVTYTPDYKVKFNNALCGKLYAYINDKMITDAGRGNRPGNVWQEVLFLTKYDAQDWIYFDVKPPSKAIRFSGALGSSREFPIKQRMMWEEHGIFVNKVVPYGQKECLFTKTFLPTRYKWTDKSTKLRVLKSYEETAKNLSEYLTFKNIKLCQLTNHLPMP